MSDQQCNACLEDTTVCEIPSVWKAYRSILQNPERRNVFHAPNKFRDLEGTVLAAASGKFECDPIRFEHDVWFFSKDGVRVVPLSKGKPTDFVERIKDHFVFHNVSEDKVTVFNYLGRPLTHYTHPKPISHIATDPNSKLFAIADDESVTIFRHTTDEKLAEISAKKAWAVVSSKDETVTTFTENENQIWSKESGIKTTTPKKWEVRSAKSKYEDRFRGGLGPGCELERPEIARFDGGFLFSTSELAAVWDGESPFWTPLDGPAHVVNGSLIEFRKTNAKSPTIERTDGRVVVSAPCFASYAETESGSVIMCSKTVWLLDKNDTPVTQADAKEYSFSALSPDGRFVTLFSSNDLNGAVLDLTTNVTKTPFPFCGFAVWIEGKLWSGCATSVTVYDPVVDEAVSIQVPNKHGFHAMPTVSKETGMVYFENPTDGWVFDINDPFRYSRLGRTFHQPTYFLENGDEITTRDSRFVIRLRPEVPAKLP